MPLRFPVRRTVDRSDRTPPADRPHRYAFLALPAAAVGTGLTAALNPSWAAPIGVAIATAALVANLLKR